MTNLRQAAQQALEALDCPGKAKTDDEQAAITALKQALAEPENQSQSQADTKVNPAEPAQKPVAWMCPDDPDRATAFAWRCGYCIDCGKPRIPVYTAPTPHKPLTDEEINHICKSFRLGYTDQDLARAIERAHGIGEQHE